MFIICIVSLDTLFWFTHSSEVVKVDEALHLAPSED